MKKKYLYIKTIGCQMNVYDSGMIASELGKLGYRMTNNVKKADLVIVNTCTIREKAEQKAFSFLGRLWQLKKRKPGMIIGMGGCLAQQEAENVIKRAPFINLIFGTRALNRLSGHILSIEKTGKPVIDIDMTGESGPDFKIPQMKNPVLDYVTIMRGCDNYCTYCVVPYVRGWETSRPPKDITDEIIRRVKNGMKEVTLLGQNVNSYGKKEGLCSFAQLLERVNEIPGLERIRFTTSHPKDLSNELINAFSNVDKLCSHIHLPVQSGSNRILKKMNRKYSRESYLDKIQRLRTEKPDIAITTDMIAGFPGETKADFNETLNLMKHIEFDSIFAFAYSDRPQVPASSFKGKIDEKEKRERLKKILDLQETHTLKKNQLFLGRTVRILVEGPSKKNRHEQKGNALPTDQWTGRTSANKIVNFTLDNILSSCHDTMQGKIIHVVIKKAFANSLWGKPVNDIKGEVIYAA